MFDVIVGDRVKIFLTPDKKAWYDAVVEDIEDGKALARLTAKTRADSGIFSNRLVFGALKYKQFTKDDLFEVWPRAQEPSQELLRRVEAIQTAKQREEKAEHDRRALLDRFERMRA